MKKKVSESNFIKIFLSMLGPRNIFLLFIFFLSQLIFIFSDSFRIQSAEVNGNQMLKGEEIVSAAQIPWGSYVWRLNSSNLEKRMSTIPWIKSASVKKGFPGLLKIYVTERNPVVAIASSLTASEFYGADTDGRILLVLTKEQAEHMPKLIIDDKIKLGDLADKQKIEVVTFFSELLPEDIRDNVISYTVDGGGYIYFQYKKGMHIFDIRFGKLPVRGIPETKKEIVSAKLDILSVMLSQMKERLGSVEYIDLRYTEPVVKFVSSTSENNLHQSEDSRSTAPHLPSSSEPSSTIPAATSTPGASETFPDDPSPSSEGTSVPS